jgi:hypothetical protein
MFSHAPEYTYGRTHIVSGDDRHRPSFSGLRNADFCTRHAQPVETIIVERESFTAHGAHVVLRFTADQFGKNSNEWYKYVLTIELRMRRERLARFKNYGLSPFDCIPPAEPTWPRSANMKMINWLMTNTNGFAGGVDLPEWWTDARTELRIRLEPWIVIHQLCN